jgi:hypothetical protein
LTQTISAELLPAFPNMASGPLLTSNHRLAALTLTGAIGAAEDDEESERSNAAADNP